MERDKKKFEKASAFRVLREEQSQQGRLYSNIQEDQKRTENMVTWKPRKAIINEGGVVAVLNATEFTEDDESRPFAPVCPILLPSNLKEPNYRKEITRQFNLTPDLCSLECTPCLF